MKNMDKLINPYYLVSAWMYVPILMSHTLSNLIDLHIYIGWHLKKGYKYVNWTFYLFYVNTWIDGYSIDWLTNIWRHSYFNDWLNNKYMERWLFHWLTNIWRDGYSIGWNRAFGGVSATTCWVFFTADPSRTTSCVASSTAAASVGGASISSTGTEILILSSCLETCQVEYA